MLFDRTDATPDLAPTESADAEPSEMDRMIQLAEPAPSEPVPTARMISRVIEAESINEYTLNGWRIARVFENATRVELSRETLQESHYGNNGHVPAKYAIAFHVISSPTFLVEKEEQLLTREARLEHEGTIAAIRVRELEVEVKSLPELKKQLEDEMKLRARIAKERDDAQAELSKTRDEIAKFKTELEKVRREIGDGRWREIGGWMGDGPNTRCNVPMCGDSGLCEECRKRGAR